MALTPLFKAKDIKTNEWRKGFYFELEKVSYIINKEGICSEVDPKTLCQHTGAYDRNEKEIFENDIVWDSYHRLEYSVSYSEEKLCFIFTPPSPHRPYTASEIDLKHQFHLEVTGNTVDTPDVS